jgi:putative colanic acid biosynthesis acetyltransferase WcaF
MPWIESSLTPKPTHHKQLTENDEITKLPDFSYHQGNYMTVRRLCVKYSHNMLSRVTMILSPADSRNPAVDLHAYDQSWYRRGRGALIVVLWDLVQSFLIQPSPHPFYAWRRFWYRVFGATIGENVLLRKSVRCNYPWKLSIGHNSWIGDEATLYCLQHIHIGENVVISQQSYLCSGTHDHRDPHFGLIVRPIVIEDGAWVALGALVMPGITVGAGALIGARAVLTKNALPWTIYQGLPAHSVGQRILNLREHHELPHTPSLDN